MTDKAKDAKPQPTALSSDGLPEEEFEDAPEDENEESASEFESDEAEDAEEFEPAAAAAGSGRRFGRGRASEAPAGHHDDQHRGSLRESHERVHIDDRPSAIFAVLCAFALVAVLVFAWVAGFVPKAAAPTYAPLVVPTAQATASPAASVSIAPSASVK
jgi:hypothetical protein